VSTVVVVATDWSSIVVEIMRKNSVSTNVNADTVVCQYDRIKLSIQREGDIFWVFRTQAADHFGREPYFDLDDAVQDVQNRLADYIQRWTSQAADILLMSVDRNRYGVTRHKNRSTNGSDTPVSSSNVIDADP
jgi:hypothetical protein